jgi:hypothetical protein
LLVGRLDGDAVIKSMTARRLLAAYFLLCGALSWFVAIYMGGWLWLALAVIGTPGPILLAAILVYREDLL